MSVIQGNNKASDCGLSGAIGYLDLGLSAREHLNNKQIATDFAAFSHFFAINFDPACRSYHGPMAE